ncbi:hypothetical protein, partial [Xanthomonas hortorum]
LLLIDTSESTIFHGLEMSRKPWAYHSYVPLCPHKETGGDAGRAMNKIGATLNAFLAGIGGAFSLFPTGQVESFMKRPTVESRMQASFARVGRSMDVAMKRAKDEQQEGREKNQ